MDRREYGGETVGNLSASGENPPEVVLRSEKTAPVRPDFSEKSASLPLLLLSEFCNDASRAALDAVGDPWMRMALILHSFLPLQGPLERDVLIAGIQHLDRVA